MQLPKPLLYLGGGLAAWGLWQWLRPAAAQGIGDSASGSYAVPRESTVDYWLNQVRELPGSGATTASQVGRSATLWSEMSYAPAPTSGYVNFPSGAQAAAALFQVKVDPAGRQIVQWAGRNYALGPQDAMGNYPAILV